MPEPAPAAAAEADHVAATVPVSALVPMYNAAAHAERAVRQLAALDPAPAEVVIVLDGCTDDTEAIVREHLGLLRCLVDLVVLPTNVGLAAARTRAVATARQEYVWFADSDDGWDPDLLGRLAGPAAADVDIVICTARAVNVETGQVIAAPNLELREVPERLDAQLALHHLLLGNISGHLWNKLIRTSLIRDYLFPDTAPYEDLGLMLELIAASTSVATIHTPLYTYGIRPGSAMNTGAFWGRSLIGVRDIARQVVGGSAGASLQQSLDYFESRWVAMAIVMQAHRAQVPPADAHLVSWARRQCRSGARYALRRHDWVSVLFCLAVITNLDRLAYSVYRRRRGFSR